MNKAPDPKSYEFFLATWKVYRKIVDGNHMHHREIFSEISKILSSKSQGPLTILDLGCGDAGTMRPILEAVAFSNYLGVDASQPALELAEEELQAFGDQIELQCSDMLSFLRESPSSPFEVILVSFSLHHLDSEHKREFLALCKERLSPSGELIIVDVFRNQVQCREEYLDAYCEDITQRWSSLTIDEARMAVTHVRTYDFPETFEDFIHMAHQVGLSLQNDVRRYGFHGLTTFRH